MTRNQFEILRRASQLRRDGIMRGKGADYAGHQDALANFKGLARDAGINPYQAWLALAFKHWTAIQAFCKEGRVESEPIVSRLDDLRNYVDLLEGLIAELDCEPCRKTKEPEVVVGDRAAVLALDEAKLEEHRRRMAEARERLMHQDAAPPAPPAKSP